MRKIIFLAEANPPWNAFLPAMDDCTRELWASPAYLRRNQNAIKPLSDSGMSIHSNWPSNKFPWKECLFLCCIGPHPYLSRDASFFKEGAAQGARFVRYNFSTDDIEHPPVKGETVFYASESQMRMNMPGARYWMDEDTLCAHIPGGGEGAALGLLHHPRYEKRDRAKNRADLAAELSKELETVNFREDRPLLLQHMSNCLENDVRDRAFERLAPYADILLKGLDDKDPESHHQFYSNAKGEGIFTYFNSLPRDLGRQAADFILPVAYGSGAMATSLMLGCRIIPVFTRHVHLLYRHIVNKVFFSFVHLMRMDWQAHELFLMEHVPPLCLESTDMIMERINDKGYWEEYDHNIASLQKKVFGRYKFLPDSRNEAARPTHRILERGTILPY